MASWKSLCLIGDTIFLDMSIVMLVFIVFAGAHRSVKDILKCSRIVFEGPFRGTKATKKSQPMVVQQGNFLQEYLQKLFHPTKKNQNAGGSFRQEFFLRDLTANLLFSSSDVSCSPGENSTRKGKDRCPSLQVSN